MQVNLVARRVFVVCSALSSACAGVGVCERFLCLALCLVRNSKTRPQLCNLGTVRNNLRNARCTAWRGTCETTSDCAAGEEERVLREI